MSSPVLCIGPDTTLRDAVDIMAENNIGCLPVVTGAFLVGMVTLEALATAGLTEEEPEAPETCVPVPPRKTSGVTRAPAAWRYARIASAEPRRACSTAWRTERNTRRLGARRGI